jgi:hypothetical protein
MKAGTLSAAPVRVKSRQVYGIIFREFEPELISRRPIRTKGISQGANTMLAFQLVGLALVVLFLGPMVSGKQRIIGR